MAVAFFFFSKESKTKPYLRSYDPRSLIWSIFFYLVFARDMEREAVGMILSCVLLACLPRDLLR